MFSKCIETFLWKPFKKRKALVFIKNKPVLRIVVIQLTGIQTDSEVNFSNVCAVKEDIKNKVSFCTYLLVDNWWCILVMVQDVIIYAKM